MYQWILTCFAAHIRDVRHVITYESVANAITEYEQRCHILQCLYFSCLSLIRLKLSKIAHVPLTDMHLKY